MEQIQEIGELIAPVVFGKPYRDLTFWLPGGKTTKEGSELFQCSVMAQAIRLDAMKSLQLRFPGATHDWPAVLQTCEELAGQPGRIESQKQKLRERGFLKA